MKGIVRVVSALSAVSCLILGSWGSSGCSSTASSGATGETVALTGQVAVRAEDVAALTTSQAGLKASVIVSKPKFATIGDTVLADADVTLVKKLADGTETEVSTSTTDAQGNYTLAEVPVCQAGTGASTDFYYEVRVTSGAVTIAAPVCPTTVVGDETVNVSPESNLAAKIISDVAKVPGEDNIPVPTPEVFADVREFTSGDVDTLQDAITIPSASDADASVQMANGMAAAGGDAEKAYKKFQFEAEFVRNTGTEVTTEETASYLARSAKEGCTSSSTALSQAAATAMADALSSGTTFTPQDIVAAFNAVSSADADVATKVADYAEQLTAVETAQAVDAGAALGFKLEEALGDEVNLGAFYTKRDLVAADFAATTPLEADQAVSFLESLGNQCNFGNTNITQIIGELTGSDTLAAPAIDQAVIYNNSGFGCNGLDQGHFVSAVDVYLPAGSERTVSSVVITSTDATSLGGDGSITLVQEGPLATHFAAQGNGECVSLDTEVTYTVTAILDDASEIQTTVVRTHPETTESIISMNGQVIQSGNSTPAVTTDKRPLISWTAPEDVLAAYSVPPPEGSQVKYTYELAYIDDASPGSPINSNTFPACATVTSGVSLYATSSFIPTVDCDVDACAAAIPTTADHISCRINIQTYLVDAYDQIQSQAAGAFRKICVDLDADGNCG